MKLSSLLGLICVSVMSIACVPLLPSLGYIGCVIVVAVTAGPLWLYASMILYSPRPGKPEVL